ncbi:MAG: ABC transporter ATP-binding protein/permease [Tepidibacter sp.]|uniref:ABC transporter ATP-binding protein n=1 Tax=Tepidibacter sp. TaxID=2529387 RepID=UPI0025FB684E|nr:ABC transporter ATP-binding protein [Tepidibacter sp.]MCT4509114.1 ABC transporter ATP-binding protein/permease [Tepidibacter sp.]
MDEILKKNKIRVISVVIKMIKESLSLVYEYDKRYLYISIGLTLIVGFFPAIQIVLLQNIINNIQSGGDDFLKILQSIILYVGINIFDFAMQEIYRCYNNNFDLKFNKFINLKMLDKSTKLKLKHFEDSEIYNIIKRAQNEGSSSVLNYIASVFDIVKQIIIISSTILVLLQLEWWIILFIFIIPIIKYIYTIHFDKKWYDVRKQRTSKERKTWYINFLLMTGNAFKEIKLLGLKDYFIAQYTEIKSEIINEDIKLNNKITAIYIALGLFDYFITGGIFTYIVYKGYTKTIMIGDVNAYTECIYNIKANIEDIFFQMNKIVEQSLYVDLLFQFFNIEEQKDTKGIGIDTIYKIELKNVSYKYPNDPDYILKNINLTAEKGDTVALVGENGSGKTTLTKLILGFYDDYEGEIFINNINLREIKKNSYIKKIGCVFQDYIKYEATLRENIGFGNVDKVNDDNKIWNILKSISLKEEVYSDSGLETVMGHWFGNKQVSIGEWQKIAIARALYKDADLYILDEPDSSIDILKQKELIHIYNGFLKQKLGIIISHRVNHIHLLADNIYVLKNGAIIENGDHDKLMKNQKLYKKLYLNCEQPNSGYIISDQISSCS